MSNKAFIFVTTTFEQSQNGPSIFAQYLWDAFKSSDEFDFHMVAPRCTVEHPRFHNVDTRPDRGMYHELQAAALELADRMPGDVIFHGNISHAMDLISRSGRKCIVQINDYESADAIIDLVSNFRLYGLRRSVSLIWRRSIERAVVKAAACIVCNSEYTQRRADRAYEISKGGLDSRVIHKAVDLDAFSMPDSLPPDPVRRQKGEVRLIYVGAHWRLKGLEQILQALPQLLGWNPNLTLYIVGPSAPKDIGTIRRLTKNLGVDDSVNILGRVARDALPCQYWHADLFVSPTLKEAFGVSLLEAMAAQLPVLANPVGQIPILLENGQSGFLINTSVPLAEEVIRSLESSDLSTIVANASIRAAQFSRDSMLRQYKKLYRTI